MRKRIPIPAKTRNLVLERDEGKCVYCGKPSSCLDHVRPWCRGGTNAASNLVAACTPCNLKAGGLLFKDLAAKKAWVRDPTKKAPPRGFFRKKRKKTSLAKPNNAPSTATKIP